MKKVLALVLLMISLVLALVSAQAEENGKISNVTYRGGAEHFIVLPGDKDLFQNFKLMMPGETREQIIILKNEYNKPLNFYMRAEEVPDESSGVRLIDILQFSLKNGDQEIYSGALVDSVNAMSEDILLGRLAPGETITMTATLYAPGPEMDNRYMRLQASVKWIFTVMDTEADFEGEIRNVGDCFD